MTDREQTHSSCCDVCGNPPRPGTVCANRAELKRLAEGSTPAYDEHRLQTDGSSRDPQKPFCEGGVRTCEVCVGSCGIEECEAERLQTEAVPTWAVSFSAQREPMFQDEYGCGWVPLATYDEHTAELKREIADLKKRLGYLSVIR